LGKLIDINAFQHEERIQEISGQASSEASLEGILKRVIFFLFSLPIKPISSG
jgi:dynein heavy chain